MGGKELDMTEQFYLHFFHFAIVNHIGMNMMLKYLFDTFLSVLPSIYPEVGLLDHIILVLIFCGTVILFSTEAGTFYILSNNSQSLQFLHILIFISTCYLLHLELYEVCLRKNKTQLIQDNFEIPRFLGKSPTTSFCLSFHWLI